MIGAVGPGARGIGRGSASATADSTAVMMAASFNALPTYRANRTADCGTRRPMSLRGRPEASGQKKPTADVRSMKAHHGFCVRYSTLAECRGPHDGGFDPDEAAKAAVREYDAAHRPGLGQGPKG
jgi:hypothetical protein